MENIKSINIEYERPRFGRRIFFRIVDALFLTILFLISFVSIQAIYSSTSSYKNAVDTLTTIRLESSLYVYKDDSLINISTYVYQDEKMSYGQKEDYLENALNSFLEYMKSISEESYNKIYADLNEFKLSSSLTYENENLFYKNENGEIVKNENVPSKIFIENFYTVFIDTNCNGYLSSEIDTYYEATMYLSSLTFYLNIPLSLFLSSLIVYFVFPLIFSRGRKTLGMLIYHVSFIGLNCYSLTFKKRIKKFLITYFLEFILSIFTFCIPLIISSSMMFFNKNHQTFAEYMVGINEVDDENALIYKNKEELINEELKDPSYKNFKLK